MGADHRKIKDYLEGGAIGKPQLVRMSVHSSGLVPDEFGNWPALQRQPYLADLPRFLVFELLVHHFDVLGWLFGDLALRSASLSRASGATKGEDTAAIHLQTSVGFSILLDATFACPDAPTHVADYCEIIGQTGTIHLDDTTLFLRGARTETSVLAFEQMYAAAYEGALAEFANGLRQGRSCEELNEGHLMALRLVEAVYLHARRYN